MMTLLDDATKKRLNKLNASEIAYNNKRYRFLNAVLFDGVPADGSRYKIEYAIINFPPDIDMIQYKTMEDFPKRWRLWPNYP